MTFRASRYEIIVVQCGHCIQLPSLRFQEVYILCTCKFIQMSKSVNQRTLFNSATCAHFPCHFLLYAVQETCAGNFPAGFLVLLGSTCEWSCKIQNFMSHTQVLLKLRFTYSNGKTYRLLKLPFFI